MKEKIEGKRKTNKIKIVFIVILVVAVLIYAGYTAWQLFAHPTDVFLVEQGSISEEIKAEGYIIRDETKVQGNNYKNGIVQIKAEGEKCAKDENIFRYYSTGEDELIQKIQELDEKIDEAQKSDTTSILPGDIKLLEKEIELRLLEISKNNNIQKITEYKREIEKYIKKKNLQIISDELELDYSYVKEVVDLIHEHPDWTDLQIGETLIMRDNF